MLLYYHIVGFASVNTVGRIFHLAATLFSDHGLAVSRSTQSGNLLAH